MNNSTNIIPDHKPFYRNPRFYLISLIILGIGLTIFFGGRALRNFQRVRTLKIGGGETNVELIRGWMTVDYITKMYHVPPEVILKPLNLPVEPNMRKSLGTLIKSSGTPDPQGMLEEIKSSINQFQQKDMIPNPPRPDRDHP